MTSTGYCYHTKDTAASTTSPAKAQAMQRDRDLRSLSNAYLKALITERGYSHDGLLTREELVSTVRPRRRRKIPCVDHSPSRACAGRGCRPRSR
eukprot:COSAG02_NODE_743_length_17764_cov_9.908916_15_plen_93_part_01